MDKIDKINKEIISIKDRISDIYRLLHIYNINDSDSINSIKEELKKYTDRLKEITDEEFK
jgi:hypothetical protein